MIQTAVARSARVGARGIVLSSSSARRAAVAAAPAGLRQTYATAQISPTSTQPSHATPGAPVKADKLPSLGSIEASWVSLPRPEQERIYSELQELQKKDWKELSLDEKKASYYIAYGPHGPRAPIVPAGSGLQVIMGSLVCFLFAGGIFALVRSRSLETPKTMTKEWKEAQNEYAKEQKMDPFTGASRPDGKGKRFETSI